MTVSLFSYQTEGATWLAGRRAGLLADEPGLGKTAQAIRAADMRDARVVQIVCPAAVAEGWRREFVKFQAIEREILKVDQDDPDFKDRVMVSSFERIERGSAFWLAGTKPDYLIIDEGHYLKTRDSKRTMAIYGPECDGKDGLVGRAGGVAVLTGTPSPNNPGELWPMLRALAPGLIEGLRGPASYWGFVNRYCRTRPGRFGGVQILRGQNLSELRQRIAPFVKRRRTNDVLSELPDAILDVLPLRADTAAKALRDFERSEDGARILAALEAGGVEALNQSSPHVATLRRLAGLAIVPSLVKWADNWLASGGEKLVIFAYHTEVIDGLARGLVKHGPLAVDGRVPGGRRQTLVDAFRTTPQHRVLLGQLTAAGTGLDGMQHATRDMVIAEASWVHDENVQVIGRLRRMGQKNAVRVRFASLVGSVHEKVQAACMRKAEDNRRLFG